jgi:hypothetical protein
MLPSGNFNKKMEAYIYDSVGRPGMEKATVL